MEQFKNNLYQTHLYQDKPIMNFSDAFHVPMSKTVPTRQEENQQNQLFQNQQQFSYQQNFIQNQPQNQQDNGFLRNIINQQGFNQSFTSYQQDTNILFGANQLRQQTQNSDMVFNQNPAVSTWLKKSVSNQNYQDQNNYNNPGLLKKSVNYPNQSDFIQNVQTNNPRIRSLLSETQFLYQKAQNSQYNSNFLTKQSLIEDPISNLLAKDLEYMNKPKPLRPDQKRNYVDNKDVRVYLKSLDEMFPQYDISPSKKVFQVKKLDQDEIPQEYQDQEQQNQLNIIQNQIETQSISFFKGNLMIKQMHAQLIKDAEMFGSMDTFVQISCNKKIKQTRPHKNGGRNPNWNGQILQFDIEQNDQLLLIELFDEDMMSNNFIGSCEIPMYIACGSPQHQQMVDIIQDGFIVGKLYMSFQWLSENQAQYQQSKFKSQEQYPPPMQTESLFSKPFQNENNQNQYSSIQKYEKQDEKVKKSNKYSSDLQNQSPTRQIAQPGQFYKNKIPYLPNENDKEDFFNLAIRIKLKFQKNHPARNAVINDLYKQMIEQQLQPSDWEQFLWQNLEQTKFNQQF